ncbi:class I SAM-dependent methyltransferase [Amphibiibacter pelophylacis]|uniref:Methyltransferase domain-containing protein n=1 Tax=Amphibiibacter pelophylacis TaxID=1799477 RepID=A0ACC6P468_9BURK
MSPLAFLHTALRHFQTTGSVAPSSRYLCRHIVASAQLTPDSRVLEVGPGNGVITRHYLPHLSDPAQATLVEINPVFCGILRRDPALRGAHVIGAGVETLPADSLEPAADVIISSVPFYSLPPSVREDISQQYARLLRPGQLWVQYTYSPNPGFFRRQPGFHLVSSHLVLRNVPPARVLVLRRT